MRVCMCMCNSSVWKEIHGPLYRAFLKWVFHYMYCMYWNMRFLCVLMCTYSIHTWGPYFLSTEVAERQPRCPCLTRKRFAANELIHQQKRVGTRGWWGEGGWGGRWRETVGRSRGRSAQREASQWNMTAVAFPCSPARSLVLWMLQLEDLSSVWLFVCFCF